MKALKKLMTSLSCRHRLPQIEVSAGDDTVALVFRVLDPLEREDAEKMVQYGKENNIFVYVQPSSPDSTLPLYQGDGDWAIDLDTLFEDRAAPSTAADIADASLSGENSIENMTAPLSVEADSASTSDNLNNDFWDMPGLDSMDDEVESNVHRSSQVLIQPTEESSISLRPLTYHLNTVSGTQHMDFFPHSFIQVNRDVNEMIVNEVIRLLDVKPSDVVLDMFCGLGNFTVPIAAAGPALVLGAELSEQAVELAAHNATKNGVTNAQFFSMNLYSPKVKRHFNRSALSVRLNSHLLSSAMHSETNIKLVIDPPRSGADALISSDLFDIRYFPQLSDVVYVSCNASTLARDTTYLQNKGFRLRHARSCNMFPHTGHGEVVSLFTRSRF